MGAPVNFYYPGSCNYMAPCVVGADGTFLFGPHGWSVTKKATGQYEIVHNLGRTNYLPVNGATAGGDYRLTSAIREANANTILVDTRNGEQFTDGGFVLLIIGV